MANAINWFEIPAVDFQRGKKFYETIFEQELHEQEMGTALMAFFPADGVGGAIVKEENSKPSQEGTLIYLNGGDDLQKILDKIESAGGKIAVPKTQITPEIGFFAIFIDTEGNKIGIHSPK
jgi:predicted enzyme related to lactoylglutathione lyase